MGIALLPIVRVLIGVDSEFTTPFFYSLSFGIGGLMCGLTAMILMARRQPPLVNYLNEEPCYADAAKLHATGLLLFTGIPLLNFLACFYLWSQYRHRSEYLDYQGREALCFQISIYLYLMMCLFMVFAIIGLVAIPLVLIFHLFATITAILKSAKGQAFRYPANITVIERTPHTRTQ